MSFIKEVSLTAREFSGVEALSVGLVSGVEDTKAQVLEKAMAMARDVAGKSPVAVVGTKEILNFSRDHSVQDGLNHVAVWNAAYTQTQDVRDAMMAGLKKGRKPTFEKL